MKTFDPMPTWKQSPSYDDWARKCEPPLSHAWLERIGMELVPAQAIAVARLLLPSFVEYDSCVFLSHKFNREIYRVWTSDLGSRVDVEKMINHTHVFDLFSDGEASDDDDYVLFAETLARTWELALSATFGTRRFEILVRNGEDEYGPTVTFCSRL